MKLVTLVCTNVVLKPMGGETLQSYVVLSVALLMSQNS